MKIVMDSDCLVKLTKAGAKEAVIMSIEVHIPELVEKETVGQVSGRNYQDAFIIQQNIAKKTLHVKHQIKSPSALPVNKGEAEALSLYLNGNYDAIASNTANF